VSTLHSLGFTSRDHVVGSVLRIAPAVVAGALGAAAVAIALSPLFPRGLARRAEPAPGVLVDPPVIVLGAAAVVVGVLGLTAVTAWWSWRRAAHGIRTAPPTALVRMADALPPPAGLGVRNALAPRGRWRHAGWAGITGVAIAVAGVLAVAAVDGSTQRLQSTPRLFGAGWDAVVETEPDTPIDELAHRLANDADVVAVGRLDTLALESVEARGPGGEGFVDMEAFESVIGAMTPTLVEGRLPAGPGELAIGAAVEARLGAHIGDTVEVDGYEEPVEFVVVGRVLDAGTDELGNGFDITRAGLDAVTEGCPPDSDAANCLITTQGIGISLRAGADRDAAIARLAEVDPSVRATDVPSIVDNLDQVGSTPWLLAAFLALLGVGGLVHAMASGSGRRDHDLAIGRALGLGLGQTRASVRWQAVTLAVTGAALGVLIGFVVGRLVWRQVAEGTGALVETVVPLWAWLVPPVAAVVIALAVAIVPAARLASRHPAESLRVE
jgi:ABC-type lipoprotein release transport system permease subunit